MDNIKEFIEAISRELATGRATEHTYRPAIKKLLQSLDPTISAINEPKQSEHGAPDFAIVASKNNDKKLGYGEAKDINISLDKVEKSEQLDRYKGYANLFLTNNLDWRFFRNGEKILEIKIGELNSDKTEIGKLYSNKYDQLAQELTNFLSQPPEKIKSGKRLSEIMGGKARRIRDNITAIISDNRDNEIDKIYEMMKELLVADLAPAQFADMYAQTLVYGLFVARYSDDTQNNFTRAEARDLVPATNPFLREFFDHITGVNFNKSLSYIVDELCEVFAISDIRSIVHRHLKITSDNKNDVKDPIIHFYEDFLASYDQKLRKSMGAYYTPTPVVRYIVRMVDKVLKEDLKITDGIASNEKIKYTHKVEQYQKGKKLQAKYYNTKTEEIPRVQILDPAVGTATFLNETIKYIHEEKFNNQKGLWQSYANDNILPRLNGFELMMTPYTIAHLKLGMTLSELGAKDLNQRLRIFLTNTLSEGNENDLPIYMMLGLTKAVADESHYAAEIKNDLPVMVVMGNPPYSISSNNKSKFASELIEPYKKNLNERNIQPLSDDYIKFIAFAEQMIAKNSTGIVAMITNNSYIDGIIHRQMRKQLLETFDKIYILDLHGNARKGEVAQDGSIDQNVFDIMQGVSIIIAVKEKSMSNQLGCVYHSEIYGTRTHKFNTINSDNIVYKKIDATAPDYMFIPKDNSIAFEYNKGIKINDLYIKCESGVTTSNDKFVLTNDSYDMKSRINDLINLPIGQVRSKYNIKHDSKDWNIENAQNDVGRLFNEKNIKKILFRPFDEKFMYYTGKTNGLISRPRNSLMPNMFNCNFGLVLRRSAENTLNWSQVFLSEYAIDKNTLSAQTYLLPLYLYYNDGTKTINFKSETLEKLTSKIGEQKPEDIFDYIYATLHSPSYRKKYAEFLKIDFPRIPTPDKEEFVRLVPLGCELRNLHLMKSDVEISTNYPESGDNIVEKIERIDDKIYINSNQYFGGVSDIAWSFYIGGYQPAQKWLKDRKGSALSADDIIHYQKIISTLNKTNDIMEKIG